jgi:hypothetical protein
MLPVDADMPMNLGVGVLALSKGYVAWNSTKGPTVFTCLAVSKVVVRNESVYNRHRRPHASSWLRFREASSPRPR